MVVSRTPAFDRQFYKLATALQAEAREKIEMFKDRANHRALKTHKLHGPLKGSYSFSVNYRFRIVFEYLSKDEAVLLAVGDHEVYR